GPQGRNLTAPAPGWLYQGDYRGFLGTPVSPNHFITAGHIGGGPGDTFVYPNASGVPTNYTVVATFDDPNTDLRIHQVSATFDSWAPRWDVGVDGAETGKSMLVFGRGRGRGAEVWGPSSIAAPPRGRRTAELKGWEWGVNDQQRSWGTNTVLGVANGGSQLGQLLVFDFSKNGGINEAGVSGGDSGGAVFIQGAGGVWKLAGINYGTNAQFRRNPSGEEFLATLFDIGGFYQPSGNDWILTPESNADHPAVGYSTRIASTAASGWINGVINSPPQVVPEPAALSIILGALPLLMRRRR
ncbi:MAG TPA: hypothetical protein PKB10_11410, partial [Tepidisphaeraceae bacterium]|nr:hypothetical protein [Tepidisphaeraceae bacterium]